MSQPEIETPRLRLRPFQPSDAERIRLLAGDRAVAEGCILIPHPYPPGLAERWIASHPAGWQANTAAMFAITDKPSGLLIGSISLLLREERQADRRIKQVGTLGYWLGRAYWGKGLMSEAVASMLDFAFYELGVDRIEAEHAPTNPASGQVMVKNGLHFIEERLCDEFDGQSHRLRCYALEWTEYVARQRNPA